MPLLLSFREVVERTIDSTPTEYRGIQMRSKLEADFAGHLDRLGVDWKYEPEIFGPRGAGYLPDFLLGSGNERTYVELKPTVEQAEAAKARIAVIWETHPDAVLLIVSAEGNRFYAALRGQPWETWQEAWAHR